MRNVWVVNTKSLPCKLYPRNMVWCSEICLKCKILKDKNWITFEKLNFYEKGNESKLAVWSKFELCLPHENSLNWTKEVSATKYFNGLTLQISQNQGPIFVPLSGKSTIVSAITRLFLVGNRCKSTCSMIEIYFTNTIPGPLNVKTFWFHLLPVSQL